MDTLLHIMAYNNNTHHESMQHKNSYEKYYSRTTDRCRKVRRGAKGVIGLFPICT